MPCSSMAVTSDVYISLLSDEFVSFLMGYGTPLILPGLKQDGVRFHTGNAVLRYLHDFFGDKVLLNWYPAVL